MALGNRKSRRARAALERIEELREEAEGERRRERELEQERASAITKHGAAREALTAALADGRDGAAERTALEEAARVASDHWPERIEAQQRRMRQAGGAIDAYIAENWRQVEREKRQRDDEARARVEQAAEELDAAIRAVNVEDSAWGPLLRARGIQRGPHLLGVDRLQQELRRAREGGFKSPTPPEAGGESAKPIDAARSNGVARSASTGSRRLRPDEED